MAVDAVEDTVPIHELYRQCAINEANWTKIDYDQLKILLTKAFLFEHPQFPLALTREDSNRASSPQKNKALRIEMALNDGNKYYWVRELLRNSPDRIKKLLVVAWWLTKLVFMQIRVLFFGMLKDLAGQGSDSLDLPENAVLGDVLSHYEERVPRLKDLMASIAMSVNQEYAGRDLKLKQGDEVALLPPVSGGSADKSSETAVRQPAEPALSERSEPKDRRFKHAAIVRERIDTESLLEGIKQPEDGAAVVFEGIVRNHSRGRRTLYLDYEAYEKMALKQMEELAEQSLSRFKIRDVAIVHRLGRLEIGETSVLIVVASAHRAAAFDACRWLIDTLKRTVPIWKKEYFDDGAVWADGEPFPAEIPRAEGTHSGGRASK